MTHQLTNQIKYISGLTFGQKSILYRLADISRDGQTVSVGVVMLAEDAGCTERTAQRNLRQLEELKVLIAVGTAGGQGHILVYQIDTFHLPKRSLSTTKPRKVQLRRIPKDAPATSDNGQHQQTGEATPAPPGDRQTGRDFWTEFRAKQAAIKAKELGVSS